MIIKFFTLVILFVSTFSCNGQTQNDRIVLGESYAKKALRETLSDTTAHNVVKKGSLLIKNKETAISIIEPLLFDIYGEELIKEQQPYESYLINNYWVIYGTLPKDYVGGTFLVIMDGTNLKIIRLTHGK